MKRNYIESSMIKSIGFESNNLTLEIEFNSGAIWQYFDFPEAEWYEFENAKSKGRYFRAEILGQYSESQIG